MMLTNLFGKSQGRQTVEGEESQSSHPFYLRHQVPPKYQNCKAARYQWDLRKGPKGLTFKYLLAALKPQNLTLSYWSNKIWESISLNYS